MLTLMHEVPHPRFLTIAQAAEELNVKIVQVRALLRSGELRGFQVGGRGVWRIGRQDLEDYIAEAHRKASLRITIGQLDALDQDVSEGGMPA